MEIENFREQTLTAFFPRIEISLSVQLRGGIDQLALRMYSEFRACVQGFNEIIALER